MDEMYRGHRITTEAQEGSNELNVYVDGTLVVFALQILVSDADVREAAQQHVDEHLGDA